MASPNYEAIASLPEYQALVAKRRKMVWPLLLVIMAVYFTFILAIAFYPEMLGANVGGNVISLGIWLALGVIFLTFIITGFYVHQANRSLEALVDAIHQKAETL